ncbi:MAG: hypothetical protein BGO43_09465 [Gammaproteobacteria bacterium 39-13]|nr:hypothetical protein [Gammaproteobacteria bacterium]OJV93870.1 MAG: hypothetical protein BGO43_09465 [Gammaproteobacteria bacterium 39-13]
MLNFDQDNSDDKQERADALPKRQIGSTLLSQRAQAPSAFQAFSRRNRARVQPVLRTSCDIFSHQADVPQDKESVSSSTDLSGFLPVFEPLVEPLVEKELVDHFATLEKKLLLQEFTSQPPVSRPDIKSPTPKRPFKEIESVQRPVASIPSFNFQSIGASYPSRSLTPSFGMSQLSLKEAKSAHEPATFASGFRSLTPSFGMSQLSLVDQKAKDKEAPVQKKQKTKNKP